ncbi:MAG: hypothetical protein ABJB66_09610 [Gemmatimonadaceae bacterium]
MDADRVRARRRGGGDSFFRRCDPVGSADGNKARLYVGGATQSTLIVNDLRLGESRGKIALWARIRSDASFANLRVTGR